MNEKAIGQLSGLAGRLVAEGLISAQAASQARANPPPTSSVSSTKTGAPAGGATGGGGA